MIPFSEVKDVLKGRYKLHKENFEFYVRNVYINEALEEYKFMEELEKIADVLGGFFLSKEHKEKYGDYRFTYLNMKRKLTNVTILEQMIIEAGEKETNKG